MQVVRYFTKEEEKQPSPENPKRPRVITHKVNDKPRKFKHKKRFNAKQENKNKTIDNPTLKTTKGSGNIPKKTLKKYSKGEGLNIEKVRTQVHQKKLLRKEKDIQFSSQQAARTETLLTEESGYDVMSFCYYVSVEIIPV